MLAREREGRDVPKADGQVCSIHPVRGGVFLYAVEVL